MLRAAIDIGSNSVRLFVADWDGHRATPVIRQIDTTRLHEGLDAEKRLSAESMARSADSITRFANQARAAGVADAEIRAFATSAVRDARNGADFTALVKELSGLDITLLSGTDEARYAYYAAALPGECGVIDIGGASTELICGVDGIVRSAFSAQLGAVRLRRELDGCREVSVLLNSAAAALKEALRCVAPLPQQWVGVAGTITTLYSMENRIAEYDPAAIQGGVLTREAAESWLERLAPMPLDERRKLPGLSYARAEIIEYGAAILVAFMRGASISSITVSDRDNLYTAIVRPF